MCLYYIEYLGLGKMGEKMKKNLTVRHYCNRGMEHIEMQEILLLPAELIGALKFQVFKYLYRFQSKGTPIKDLEKAQVYLRWLLEVVGEQPASDFIQDPSEMSAKEILGEIEEVSSSGVVGRVFETTKSGSNTFLRKKEEK